MTSHSSPSPVVCRVHPALWLAAVALAGHGTYVTWAVAHATTTRGGTPAQAAALAGLSFGVAVLLICLALIRVRVVGDETGLTWTGFLYSRHADWPQVRSVGPMFVLGKRVIQIRTEAGNINMNSSMTNKDAMVALIESRIRGKGAFDN